MSNITALSGQFLFMLSTGRDSVVMLDMVMNCIDKDRVTVVYQWIYPKGVLTYRDNYIKSLEQKYGIEILYEPHFEMYLVNKKAPKMKFADNRDYLMKKHSCDWCFYGWRRGESMQRHIILSHTDKGVPISHDPKGKKWNDPQKQIYPLWNMGKKEVVQYVVENEIELTPEYDYGFRDINIFNDLSVQWLHDIFPEDFKRLCKYDDKVEKTYYQLTSER
jgi:3'-phosphoadenosine 5'-phosphosulfate sulfotransferase (PAPS reductase)/FAD synthetase